MPTNFKWLPLPSPQLDVEYILSVLIEVLLYGVHTCLFFEASYIMLKKRKKSIAPNRVFLVVTFLMYIVSTAHICLALHRMLKGFVWRVQPPALVFGDFRNWETVAHICLWWIMTWLGDGLVIYRCWVVWGYSYWVIALPIILLILEFSEEHTLLAVWATHLGTVSFRAFFSWLAAAYTLVLSQNVITTGLLGFRIWAQNRISVTNGVIDTSSTPRLNQVFRIVIESAAIYTIQLLAFVILSPLGQNGQFIIQSALIPSIGIVFVLIAVRVHLPKSTTFFPNPITLREMPNWLGDNPSHNTQDSVAPRSSTVPFNTVNVVHD